MHINMAKGDFIYKQWDQHSINDMKIKCDELEKDGWIMKEKTYDNLNAYFHFKKEKEEIIITFMLC